ncbi:MAG TPA: maleylacetoacetate isomerase [Noviherbaspirillum sp.]|nr:maleylacetoacetate isomerase [Noviherbaspirillum sp.]
MSTTDSNLFLYNYFRSSSSYRVRIALNLKGLEYRYIPVHLNRDGGEQYQHAFKALNPHCLVPVLHDQNIDVTQSLAILEYLEERYPERPLLPTAVEDRAYVRQISLAIACDIHPLNNLRVLKFLGGSMGLKEEMRSDWIRHWITLGLAGLEEELRNSSRRGTYCYGHLPTIADCCLVPQLFNAQRFGIDIDTFPTLSSIATACNSLDAFRDAHPSRQPDSE